MEDGWYFPRTATAAGVEAVWTPHRCAESAILAAVDEPILANGAHIEGYRLVWKPSLFSKTRVVRIERLGTGCRAVVKRISNSEAPITFEVSEGQLPCERFAQAARELERAGCWNESDRYGADRSRDRQGVDGEDWTLEGMRGAQHWSLTLW